MSIQIQQPGEGQKNSASKQKVTPNNNFAYTFLIMGIVAGAVYAAKQCDDDEADRRSVSVSNMSGPQKPLNVDKLPAGILTPEQTRAMYDRGLQLATAGIPLDFKDPRNPQLMSLSAIKHFRQVFTQWAEIKNGNIISLGTGRSNGAWMAVHPYGSDGFNNSTNLVSMGPRSDINLLEILPIEVTDIWAGIISMHELTHLYDRVSGIEKPGAGKKEFLQGELRAYMIELYLIDHITKGSFSKKIKEIVTSLNIRDKDHLMTILYNIQWFNSIKGDLDKTITAESPKSDNERWVRDGLYQMALAIMYARLIEPDVAAQLQLQEDLIEMIMSSN